MMSTAIDDGAMSTHTGTRAAIVEALLAVRPGLDICLAMPSGVTSLGESIWANTPLSQQSVNDVVHMVCNSFPGVHGGPMQVDVYDGEVPGRCTIDVTASKL
jgi:hypothetical protein